MTLTDIKARVMHQIGGDLTDLGDYIPFIDDYMYEAYDRLLYAFTKEHATTDDDQLPMTDDRLQEQLPLWSHPAIADYTTYCLYRNGNGSRQSRGQAFLSAFLQIEARLQIEAAGSDRNKFINIPW